MRSITAADSLRAEARLKNPGYRSRCRVLALDAIDCAGGDPRDGAAVTAAILSIALVEATSERGPQIGEYGRRS